MHAYEGWALSTGAKKKSKLDADGIRQLRAELEDAKRKERMKHGNA